MTQPGSPRRFEELVRDHARLMASAIRRVCGRRHVALIPDAEQEVRLALWKRLQGGKEIEYPVSYLYKMALTTALALVRKQESSTADLAEGEALTQERAEHRPGDLLPAERARLVREVLDGLEPDEARALQAYLAGFSHAEVAELYGWSESVARHRIYRTLARLREEAR